ncbi:MAG TPA: pyridoxamine 5'-phosphate oxidase family protein [Vicinamibacteria bacterium]|nr:pyridoxamine 5'-phosphate oxidase family protein [Vicinamibacteria bacterium]
MTSPFHPGELELQERAGVAEAALAVGRIIASELPAGIERFLARQRFAVAASVESSGRVWASLLTGPAGFIAPVDRTLLRLAARPSAGDPLADALAARPELGVLVLDPRTRQRMRFNGRGLLSPEGVFLRVEQAYGNCPKYIQRRRPEPDAEGGAAGPTRVGSVLDARQQEWVARADTFFIASLHPEGGADASHRGGFPGFVRVLARDRLAFDDYPGNGMFNTLGNLVAQPRAGLLFVDFATGGVLQLTGRAEVGRDFCVAFKIEEVADTPRGSALRFSLLERSPANPQLSHGGERGISRAGADETDERRAR